MNDNSTRDAIEVVHPSSLGWKHVRDNIWQKPDGNHVAFAPGSPVQVIAFEDELEERREQIRFGIG